MNLSIASKTFILGEYAVLAGLPAVVASVGPRFSMEVSERGVPTHGSAGSSKSSNGSPLIRFLEWTAKKNLPELELRFVDPHQGAGGFGASTAEFALAYFAYQQIFHRAVVRSSVPAETLDASGPTEPVVPLSFTRGLKLNWADSGAGQHSHWPETLGSNWQSVWSLYRELMTTEPVPPSGADLVAQWQGGVVLFHPKEKTCSDLFPLFNWSQLLVFSATGQPGRKVPTHVHLTKLCSDEFGSELSPGGSLFSSLEKLMIDGITALQNADVPGLGLVMDRYADTLNRHGLEVDATTKDRVALRKLPGVAGVKGCGAMQADSVLVLLHPSSGKAEHEQVIRAARDLGLDLVADGLTCHMGVMRC